MEKQESIGKARDVRFAKFAKQFKHYWPEGAELKKMEGGCWYDAEIITPEGLKYMVEIQTRPNQTWAFTKMKYEQKYGATVLFNIQKYMRLRHLKGDWDGRFIAYMFDDYWMWINMFDMRIQNIINITPRPDFKEICDESSLCIWVDDVYEVK